MVTIDVVTFSPQFEPVDTFHAVIDSKADPGPFHLHGVSEEEFASAKKFGQILRNLDRLIDGRTLILHNTPRMWGFIVSEAKRAMNDAARANRNTRGSRRGGRGRRRHRVGHVPRPEVIVDTLASARRQGVVLDDVRIRGVANTLIIDAPPAQASVDRARAPHRELCRAETMQVTALYRHFSANGPLSTHTPDQLRADKFGLQRSHVRVQAQEQARTLIDPGTYEPGKSLVSGMEVVVAPELEMDPNIIIQAVVDAGLA